MERIGTCERRGDDYWFSGGNSEQGVIFKDHEAYNNDWDAPCYVPEYGFPEGEGFKGYASYYTHNDILNICYGNQELCDVVFNSVDWQHVETYLEELEQSSDFELICGLNEDLLPSL